MENNLIINQVKPRIIKMKKELKKPNFATHTDVNGNKAVEISKIRKWIDSHFPEYKGL